VSKGHLLIWKPPFFTEKPEGGSVVRVGDSKVFECKVLGTPEISVHWFRDGNEIHQSVKHKISFFNSVATLEISQVNEKDSGKYFCEACNEAGTESCTVELEVKGWQVYLCMFTPCQQFVKGSTAVFTCKVAGSAPFKVTWMKDRTPIKPSPKYVITDREYVGLKIKDCKVDDVGTYHCMVSNEVGSCTGFAVIPPTFIRKLTNIQAIMGSLVTMECKVAGSLPISIEWRKGTQNITQSSKYKLLQIENTMSLEFKLTDSADTGEYSCKVSNKAGSTMLITHHLFVPEPPSFVEKPEAREAVTITLPAKMMGIPIPTAKWMTDGKEIASEGRYHIETSGSSTILSIPECQRGDTGEYILSVSNPAGSKTAALHVTVLDLPGPPIGPINILEVHPDHMMIQWRAPKDDGGTPIINYVVEKKDVKKPWEPWSVVSSSGVSTRAKVSRLEKGREYIVRVRAENKIGIGAGLESPPTIAKHMFNPPGPPGLPECSDITENAVTLTWTLPEYDGGSPISGYVIERREMTGKWIRVNKTPVLDLRYRVSGLFEGNSYEFRAFAENIAGISEPSPTSKPIKATRAITKPGPPANLKLKDWSKSHADICWTKPTRDGGSPILGYVVEAQKSGTAQWNRINKDLIKMCAYRVPGLIEGMEYRIRVRATNKVGDSEPRELAETILAKDILVPPEVVVDVLTLRCGLYL
uniref:non-specific serine/threonine protein kinase n=1 Tax=Mastacembelus armatus TaxID=205130 RepID=A0A7N8YP90_9TELE